MDQMDTFNISQNEDEADTSDEDLDDTNEPEKSTDVVTEHKFGETFKKWARKEESQVNSAEPLKFMLLDSDFSIISATKVDPLVVSILPQNLRSQKEHSYNRLYGVTESGQSVLFNAFGFVPYFYALPTNPAAFKHESIQELQQRLNAEIIKDVQNRMSLVIPYHDIVDNSLPILEIQVLNTADVNIYEFHAPGTYSKANGAGAESVCNRTLKTANGAGAAEEDKPKILKIICRMPKFVWTAMKIFKKNLISCPTIDDKPCHYQTFEGSINHNIRFLTDMNLSGCSWLEIPAGKFFRRQHNSKLSHCQFEADAHYQSIAPAPIQSNMVPPLRVLSFDIECMVNPPNFQFPKAELDQVLQIGTILITYRNSDADKNNVKTMERFMFMMGSCDEMEDTHVYSFDNEAEMLHAWRLFVEITDPDILMGFNHKKFDIPYLVERANTIKAQRFPFLGRIKQSETTARKMKNVSKKALPSWRTHDERAIRATGRIVFDMMILIARHNTKPGRCGLLDVAKRYLKSHETKEDVSFKDIHKLQAEGPTGRKKLASYCVQDSRLPYLIMLEHNPNVAKGSEFNTLSYYIDKARQSGTPLRYLVTKSIDYSTYFKVIRKHKHPTTVFVPNTPAKATSQAVNDQSNKRRNSAPPHLTGTPEADIGAEREFSSTSISDSVKEIAEAKNKKLCVRKELFTPAKEDADEKDL